VKWLLEALRDDDAYTVLGGDFNTWTNGAGEPALRMLERWEFARGTPVHASTWSVGRLLGILDHVFGRLPSGATAEAREIDDAYGSDHLPLLTWVRLTD
jgi:endonuclease/exonuclease/phosphatase (EEP) superfamily protein YafD